MKPHSPPLEFSTKKIRCGTSRRRKNTSRPNSAARRASTPSQICLPLHKHQKTAMLHGQVGSATNPPEKGRPPASATEIAH
eukprot:8519716-Pyramimonas_sp.AAC.1